MNEIIYTYIRGRGWLAGYVGAPLPRPKYEVLTGQELEDVVARIRQRIVIRQPVPLLIWTQSDG